MSVVGLHFDADEDDYSFICIVDDGNNGIYATRESELKRVFGSTIS